MPLTSLDQLLQEVNKTIFQADFFTILQDNPGAYFSMKNLLTQIDLSICPSDVAEIIYDLQLLLDEVNTAYIRLHGIEEKTRTKQEALSQAYDQTSKLTEKAEALELSKNKAKDRHDILDRSILFWESQIKELKQKIEDARTEQTNLKSVDDQGLADLVSQSLKQMEMAEGIGQEIKELEGIKHMNQCRINLCKSKFAKLKRDAPFTSWKC
jgi:chromosome segregation ATPase